MKKQFSNSLGFTLIELLAVMIVFVAIGSLVTSILVSVLRGNNKTNAINAVQTNGDYAITQVVKSIRGATVLLLPTSCGPVATPTATSSVKLGFPDGSTTIYSCFDANNIPSVTSNSASLIDTNAISVVSCKFTCGQDDPSDYPIIGVDFFLQSKGTSLSEQKASVSAVEFQTSVVIRNLIR